MRFIQKVWAGAILLSKHLYYDDLDDPYAVFTQKFPLPVILVNMSSDSLFDPWRFYPLIGCEPQTI